MAEAKAKAKILKHDGQFWVTGAGVGLDVLGALSFPLSHGASD